MSSVDGADERKPERVERGSATLSYVATRAGEVSRLHEGGAANVPTGVDLILSTRRDRPEPPCSFTRLVEARPRDRGPQALTAPDFGGRVLSRALKVRRGPRSRRGRRPTTAPCDVISMRTTPVPTVVSPC